MLRLTDRIYLVGSEQFGMSHPCDCNIYLLDGGSERALIDTGLGYGVQAVLAHVRAAGFDPRSITKVFVTHHHAGHSGGCRELKVACGGEVLVPMGVGDIMANGTAPATPPSVRLGEFPPDYEFPCIRPDGEIADGAVIRIGDLSLRAILVRGHTKDSTCYLLEGEERALFTGDALFYGGVVGIVNLPGSSIDEFREDIHKLAGLNVAQMFPAHGVFVLSGGQHHVDAAIAAFDSLRMPRTFFDPYRPRIQWRQAEGPQTATGRAG